jgi:uncharacterized protein YbaR (Trm112 family)
MNLDPKLLEVLVCPVTKGALVYDSVKQELISPKAEARTLSDAERGGP